MSTAAYTNADVSTATWTVDYDEIDNSPVRCAVCGRFIGKRGKPLAIAWRKGRYFKMRHYHCSPDA